MSSIGRQLSRSNSGSSISTSISLTVSNQSSTSQFCPFPRINETDRLISDQGLITPRVRSSTSNRKVRDKSYFKGLIYQKGREICDEIRKIQNENDLLNIDRSTYLPYKKKAESKALELQNLQITLATYNEVDDMLNRDILLEEAEEMLRDLQVANKEENKEFEKMFDSTKQREITIKELETDLSQEDYVTEILTVTTNSTIRNKYSKLKRMDDALQISRINQEKELQELRKESKLSENQLNKSKEEKEALKLLKTLRQMDSQREEFFSMKTFPSVEEGNEYLKSYSNECSDVLKGITQENRDLEAKIKDIKNELQKAGKDFSNPFKERSEKYAKLKKREIVIDEFFSSYEEQQLALQSEHQKLEKKITALLQNISHEMVYFNQAVLTTETKNTTQKQKKFDPSELKFQLFKLASDFNDINILEKKLEDELKTVKYNINIKEEEITKLSNIESMKERIKKRECELNKQLKNIKNQIVVWKYILKDLKKYHDSLDKRLNNNETHLMLSKLEKHWHSLEEENFSLKNCLETPNYLSVKNEVKKIYFELNKML